MEPLWPGTLPLTRIRFLSARIFTTARFWVVRLIASHVTGHLFILENTPRPLTETIGATSTMKHRSMRGRATCKVPTLDDTLEAAPFGFGDDVYHFDVLENGQR